MKTNGTPPTPLTEQEIREAFAVLRSLREEVLWRRQAVAPAAQAPQEYVRGLNPYQIEEALLLELDRLHPHALLRLRDAVNDAIDRRVPVVMTR